MTLPFLSLPSAGITAMCHHDQFVPYLFIKLKKPSSKASHPTKLTLKVSLVKEATQAYS
jgi:hypothetical protein